MEDRSSTSSWQYCKFRISRSRTYFVDSTLTAIMQYIFKASEKNPFSSLAIAKLFKEAGFPDGVVNFVSGGGKTGALLAAHMDIDKISFTGSGTTGRKVMDAGIKSNMKRVTLELGGKSPAIVFGDADVEVALKGFIFVT